MSSYGSTSYQVKGAYAPRPSPSSSTTSSNYAQSAHSSRSYGGRPQAPVSVHNGGGQIRDPNTSTSVEEKGKYY